MKRNAFIPAILFLWFITISANAQEINSDSLNMNVPREEIQVNKEYDEDGNIIRYDSSYSWSYYGDGSGMMNDSTIERLFNELHKEFMFDDFSFFPPGFGDHFFFQGDTLSPYSGGDFEFFHSFDMDYLQKIMEEFFKDFDDHAPQEYEHVIPKEKDKQQPAPEEEKKIKLKNDRKARKQFI